MSTFLELATMVRVLRALGGGRGDFEGEEGERREGEKQSEEEEAESGAVRGEGGGFRLRDQPGGWATRSPTHAAAGQEG